MAEGVGLAECKECDKKRDDSLREGWIPSESGM
ncbi:unnamed protein product, partial [marine sediment metagenome]